MIVRVCMKPGCETQVTPPHLLCVHCWHLLPKLAKTAVQERLRGWNDTAAAREYIAMHFRSTERQEAR
jgi:hypothetical protein